MIYRDLEKKDYIEYINLIKNFRPINNEMNQAIFDNIFDKITSMGKIIICIEDNKIIGSVTLIIEQKFIHNLSKYIHVEDVFVSEDYRKKGIGYNLIKKSIEYGKFINAYKLTLTCNKNLNYFYRKNNLEQRDIQMSILL